MKLKKILEEIQWDKNQQGRPEQNVISPEQRKKMLEMIKSYNKYGEALHQNHNLLEIAKELDEIANFAEAFTMQQIQEDGKWFEGKTVERNMKELKKKCEEFKQISSEARNYNLRSEALWEEMGHLLQRYFEISEVADSMPIGGKTITQQPVKVDEDSAGMPLSGKTVQQLPASPVSTLEEETDAMPGLGKIITQQPKA